MNIELKEAAQQVLKELGEARKIVRASSSRQLAKDWDRRATDALANLRNAIQQADAQQPATGEPVAYVDREGFIIETGLLLTPGTKLYTRPAPSVQAMDNLDAYIARHEANRAAMLAAK